MTLRARLILALLAISLLPTAAFTVFTLDQLGRSTQRWFQPGVDRALESAVETTKTSIAKLEDLVRRESTRWAGDCPTAPIAPARLTAIRAELGERGIDFLQVYAREGGRWRAIVTLAPTGVLIPVAPDLGAELDAALAEDRVVRSPSGALAGVARAADGRAVVAGFRVPPDFAANIDRVTEGMSFYRRLGVVVDLQKGYVWMLVVGLALALAVLAFVIATALARDLSRPLRRLTDAVERVAAGDLATRIEPSGANEMRQLGVSFNTMTAGLERAREALREAEREAAWREVARRLAHEFKNILTPMALSLYRLESRVETAPEAERAALHEIVGALGRGVEQMTRLTEQFSQYARLPEPRFEALDLTEVARASAAAQSQGAVPVEVEGGGRLEVRGDTLLLSRAIENLVINACEASPDGAAVQVKTGGDASLAWVEVLDRGAGIPETLRAQVFEPYVSTKRRGSGLGLALVRDIAVQHGGQITLEPRDGGGTRARLTLPRGDGTRETSEA